MDFTENNLVRYEDNMNNFLTAFSDQLKYIRDDIASISKQLESIKTTVGVVNIQVAKLEQQSADRLAVCNSHSKSIDELYGRMTTAEINATHIKTRLEESAKQDAAVEKAQQKYSDWLQWLAPHLWKLALAIATIGVFIEYYINNNARPK